MSKGARLSVVMIVLILVGTMAIVDRAALHAACLPSDSTPNETWITNGTVYSLAATGSTIYIGGSFSYVVPIPGMGYLLIPAPVQRKQPFPKLMVKLDVWFLMVQGGGISEGILQGSAE